VKGLVVIFHEQALTRRAGGRGVYRVTSLIRNSTPPNIRPQA